MIIIPTDFPIISFEKANYVIEEENKTLEVCITGFALSPDPPPPRVYVEAVSSSASGKCYLL